MPPIASTYRPPGHDLPMPRRAGRGRYWGLAVLAALSLVIAAPGASTSNAEARDGDVVLWSADNEAGNTSQWDGVWISGDASSQATSSMAHSGRYGNALTIYNADGNGSSPGVRMTYQGRNLAERTDPENLPNSAYYSAWYFIPEHVSVGQQSGWNIFQWKTGYFNGTQRTARALYWIDLDDYGNELYLELFTRVNDSGSWVSGWANNIAVSPTPVPIGRWFHLESYYKWDSNGNGRVTTWLDGAKVWDIGGLKTEFDWPFNVYRREWTVNNYARQTTPTTHTLYIDDAAVATTRLGP